MNKTITNYVDKALAFATRYQAYLMYEEEPVTASMAADIPLTEQLSRWLMMEHPGSDGLLLERMEPGQYGWQPVEAAVTDADIREVEERYDIRLPDDYKEYLRYKHFYTIFFRPDIKLYPKPAGTWKARLFEPNDEMQEELLGQGYFAIGDFSDHGVICLALDSGRVIMIDFECGAPEEEEDEEVLGDSFANFLEKVLQEGEATVRELKDWEKKIYR